MGNCQKCQWTCGTVENILKQADKLGDIDMDLLCHNPVNVKCTDEELKDHMDYLGYKNSTKSYHLCVEFGMWNKTIKACNCVHGGCVKFHSNGTIIGQSLYHRHD